MNIAQNTSAAERVYKACEPKPSLWRFGSWWGLRLGGALAFAWFLIRVIPKPSRATYPCQRAAFPVAAGFVLWVMSVVGSMAALRKARTHLHQARWMMAGFCLLLAIGVGTSVVLNLPTGLVLGQDPSQAQPGFSPTEPVNTPMGTGFGIKPGRVVWAFDPQATTWDGTANGWWDDLFTHPKVVEQMLSGTIRSVGDAAGDKEAWGKIFADHNVRKGKGRVGYKPGEKIAIKLNLNQTLRTRHSDGANGSYIAPQLVQALLRQLVKEAGVAPSDITCYDATRYVPSTIFDRCTKEFPGVHFVDWTGGDGREPYRRDPKAQIQWAQPLGGPPVFLPTCVTEAEYLINVAGLKGHTIAGITVCAKNHLGTMLADDRSGNPSPNSPATSGLHTFIGVKPGRRGEMARPMGSYNALVDLNGHKDIGGKTLLYLIDGLYATRHNEYRLDPTCRWESAPFNHHWTASLFASQDGVAIDSVALDFLRSEPTLAAIVTGTVDNYLHEAALAHQPPSKTVYDPEKDGKPLASQGVHEHWNNARDKQYSRNLSAGEGIELVRLPPAL
jgi:uncharacterized protein (DUF362 family)